MNFKLIILLISTVLASVVDSDPNPEQDDEPSEEGFTMKPRIIKGVIVPPESTEFPYYVSIHKWEDNKMKFFCGGSILNPTHVLTAAHCITPLDVSQIHIRPNYDNLVTTLDNSMYYPVARADCDQVPGLSHDICMLYLDEPIEFTDSIGPIELTSKQYPPGTQVTIVGLGLNEFFYYPDELLTATVTILSDSECQQKYITRWVTDLQLCAIGENGEDTYRGDSGGPYVVTESGVPYLIGVTSYSSKGDYVKYPDRPGVFVNVYHWLDWINSRLN